MLISGITSYLRASTTYFATSALLSDPANYPTNNSLRSLALGLAEGWKAYGKDDAKILFVCQEGERNVFDQRWLEWELLET